MGAMDLVTAKDQGSASSSSSPPCLDMDMSESNKKCCVDCKATKTPLWRSGPAGPKSLCNACGIRYRKRRASLGLSKGAEKSKERAPEAQDQAHSNENGESTAATDGGLSESMQTKLVALGKDLLNPAKKQRCRRRKKMGEEEEQAAVCLLAMSCGYVFA